MRTKTSTLVIASALLASAAFALPPGVRAVDPVVRWVAPTGTPAGGPGTSCANPGYVGSTEASITAALGAASAGDTVHICAGTYLYAHDGYDGSLPNDITIEGEGVGATILDGDGSYFLLAIYTTTNLTIEGITFQNGYDYAGGGVYFSSSTGTVAHCAFLHNGAEYGGALLPYNSTIQVTDTAFNNNYTDYASDYMAADYGGAAIYVEHGAVAVSRSSFTNNVTPATSSGAGILVYIGSLSVDRSQFSGNRAGQAPAIYSYGANPSYDAGESIVVTKSTFIGNTNIGDDDGAAIGHERNGRDMTIANNVFKQNTGAADGGAIEAWLVGGNLTITGNTFTGNRATEGGALWIDVRNGTTNIRKNRFLLNRASSGGAISFECETVSPRIVSRNLARQNAFNGNVANHPSASANIFQSAYDTTGEYCLPPG